MKTAWTKASVIELIDMPVTLAKSEYEGWMVQREPTSVCPGRDLPDGAKKYVNAYQELLMIYPPDQKLVEVTGLEYAILDDLLKIQVVFPPDREGAPPETEKLLYRGKFLIWH